LVSALGQSGEWERAVERESGGSADSVGEGGADDCKNLFIDTFVKPSSERGGE